MSQPMSRARVLCRLRLAKILQLARSLLWDPIAVRVIARGAPSPTLVRYDASLWRA